MIDKSRVVSDSLFRLLAHQIVTLLYERRGGSYQHFVLQAYIFLGLLQRCLFPSQPFEFHVIFEGAYAKMVFGQVVPEPQLYPQRVQALFEPHCPHRRSAHEQEHECADCRTEHVAAQHLLGCVVQKVGSGRQRYKAVQNVYGAGNTPAEPILEHTVLREENHLQKEPHCERSVDGR